MASYVMHLAIAEGYLKKHPEEDRTKFIDGTIAPDLTSDKSLTHYGKHAAWANPYKYLQKNNNNIEDSFKRGYFLHLITDYLFYHKLIDIDTMLLKLGKEEWIKRQYNDFMVLNDEIIEKYQLSIPEVIESYMSSKKGNLLIFDRISLYKFIEELSNIDLDIMKKSY